MDLQVTIVDDFSPEDDIEKLKAIYTYISHRVLKNPQNRGYPYTVNRGVETGRAPFVLLLNSDVVLHENCLQEMVSTLKQIPDAGIVGAKLLFPVDSHWLPKHSNYRVIQHAGLAFNLNGPFHIHHSWSEKNPRVNRTREVSAVTGACLMVRRTTWKHVARGWPKGDPTRGALNLVYGRGTYEDVELCIAAKALGYSTIYNHKAVATHETGASVGAVGGYPLSRNAGIFRARCGHLVQYDEHLQW